MLAWFEQIKGWLLLAGLALAALGSIFYRGRAMRSLKWLGWMMTLLLMSFSVIGCAVPARVGIEYCEHAWPIYFDSTQKIDQTPPSIRRQILGRNGTWAVLCGSRGGVDLSGRGKYGKY